MADLSELERELSELSHTEDLLSRIERFSGRLKNTADRIRVFNADKAFVRQAISREETSNLGFNLPEDAFAVLQGDVVSTEAAYFLGERVTGNPKYVALNSSCDLFPGRRQYASLLRVVEIQKDHVDSKRVLDLLLRFKKRESMYLPALPCDAETVICNSVQFDGICQIGCGDLLLARRIASLSLVGWRIFASFTRVVLARAGEREVHMRRAVEQPPQGILDLSIAPH